MFLKTLLNTKKNCIILAYCILVSFIFLSICSKSSLLYPFNDWVDVNAIFTVGKGMFHGQIPYRDLVDTKGPLLFFIFGISYFISNTSFLGLFLIEVISFSAFLFVFHFILILYFKKNYIFYIAPIIASIILSSNSFSCGGSAEEFILPLFLVSIYIYLKFSTNNFSHLPNRYFILNGFIAGNVFCIKYTMLGFWFGWILVISIFLLFNKNYKKLFIAILFFISGMLIAILPWVIYFILNNALYDYIYIYIIKNIFSYTKTSSLNIFYSIYLNYTCCSIDNFLVFICSFIGLVFYIYKFPSKYNFGIIPCFLFLIIGIYIGGVNYVYYYLPIASFSIFGFIYLLSVIENKKIFSCVFMKTILPLNILFCIYMSYTLSPNTCYLFTSRDSLAQFKFKEIINQTPNATLLNYNSLDRGLYTTTNIFPNTRFYHLPNFTEEEFPEILKEQKSIIRSQQVDYVLVTNTLENPEIFSGYKLISCFHQDYRDAPTTYYLYKKVSP